MGVRKYLAARLSIEYKFLGKEKIMITHQSKATMTGKAALWALYKENKKEKLYLKNKSQISEEIVERVNNQLN